MQAAPNPAQAQAPEAVTQPVNQRVASKTRTRETVLATARAMFDAERYDDVTMRRVGVQAELSTGAVYANFADKEALWRAAMPGLEPPIDSPLTRAAAPMRQMLRALLAGYPPGTATADSITALLNAADGLAPLPTPARLAAGLEAA